MRDLFAGIVAILLLLVAASLASTLKAYRRRRQRTRDSERALGRTIVVEIPGASDLILFSEDPARFYYGETSIDKDLVVAVRIVVNGIPMAEYRSHHARPKIRDHQVEEPGDIDSPDADAADAADDHLDGIIRDRWDVHIETVQGKVIIECGAIREHVSQELARAVFDAVKRDLVDRDHHSSSGTPAR